MAVNEQQVQDALRALIDPNTHKDYVTGKSVKNLKVEGDRVTAQRMMHNVDTANIYRAARGLNGKIDRWQMFEYLPPMRARSGPLRFDPHWKGWSYMLSAASE